MCVLLMSEALKIHDRLCRTTIDCREYIELSDLIRLSGSPFSFGSVSSFVFVLLYI